MNDVHSYVSRHIAYIVKANLHTRVFILNHQKNLQHLL